MLTNNVYQRVFQLWAADRTGTAFAIAVDARRCLVTAKHVLAGASEVALTRSGRPRKVAVNGMWEAPDADVAVIALGQPIADPLPPIRVTSEGMYYSQDAYIVGFPLGIAWEPKGDPNNGFPLALPKRALISGELRVDDDKSLMLLDAHANEGFSGGPVVINSPQPRDVQVVAIVVGYRARRVAVEGKDASIVGQVLETTGLSVAENVSVAVEGARGLGSGVEVTSPSTDLGPLANP